MVDKINWISLEEALSFIKNGSTIVTAMAAGEPQIFYQDIASKLTDFKDIKIFCANPSQAYALFCDKIFDPHVEMRPLFLSVSTSRKMLRERVSYTPGHLSQWVSRIFAKQEIDIFWGSCSLPDARGFVSLGPSNCYESEILKRAKIVILEANPNIPFTFGATPIPVAKITAMLKSERQLPECSQPQLSDSDIKIANLIGELVCDEATLQLGIGAIPNALAQVLKFKKNLGIHTEMINDCIVDLVHSGAVTGGAKTLWPDKVIGSFAFGSKSMYQFMDHNPMVELHPASIVNNPDVIGKNHRMVSINTAVEIDITGQVCSESLGHRELSGVGGATDTHIGAQRSNGGMAIIALESLTKKGVSKIVTELKPGAKVSINRNDIDTVVTEYGVAHLAGRSVTERAKSLIAIANPSEREKLFFDAKKFGYL